MNYWNKYLKYKQLYFDAKYQYGGNTEKHYKLESTTLAFIKSLENSKPIYTYPFNEARRILKSATVSTTVIPANVSDIDTPDNVSVRLVRPLDNNDKLPVVLYLHGGGWILGDKDTHDRLIKQIATEANVVVAFVNYTPAPEAQYPTQINEAYSAALYIANHADELNVDSNNLIVAGDSVGGNMAIALTLMAKQKGTLNIKSQILLYPVTDASMDTESYKEFADGPWLTKKAMKWFYNAYLVNGVDANSILVSPLRIPTDNLRNLPPALVITDENDVLRDEGEAFAHKLMDANVDVTSARFLGTVHDFLILEPLKLTPAVSGALSLIVSYIQKVTSQ